MAARSILLLVALGLTMAQSSSELKIMGGSPITAQIYPYIASLLHTTNYINYLQSCAGTILTSRAVLSAAHCFAGEPPSRWRIRIGSSYPNSGGTLSNINQTIIHENYNARTYDNDIAILKPDKAITFGATVAPASIAGTNYYLPDDKAVWAVGWGATSFGGSSADALRHVQIWTVNQNICQSRYATIGYKVTENMLCAGFINYGGRGQCQDDDGGPLVHENVIVGIYSWGHQCGLPNFPGVNTRISKYTPWIQKNA